MDFGADRAKLAAEVERFLHVNCDVAAPTLGASGYAPKLPPTPFAREVTLHGVLHEAYVRRFIAQGASLARSR